MIFNYFFTSPVRAKGLLRGSVAPREGMAQFPKALKASLEARGAVFHLGTKAPAQQPGPTVIACDLENATLVLEQWQDSRAQKLKSLPFVDLMSVNAFFRTEPPVRGFGVLFPRQEGVTPLGVLMNSCIFENRSTGSFSETWIFGGLAPQKILSQTDDEILAHLHESRNGVFLNKENAMEARLNRWPRAIPLYGVQLEAALSELPVEEGQRYLMGNYLGQLGLNRLFHQARELAASMAAK